MALVACAGGFVGLALAVLVGCASSPTPAQQAAVGVDSVEQVACVKQAEAGVGKAALEAAIDACRAAVKAKRDGGAS